MIAVGIITAPRAVPTIARSFASYTAAGFAGPTYVFAEPGAHVDLPAANVHVRRNETRKGNFRNWVKALEALVAVSGDPWIMICEDDISWAVNAADILRKDLHDYKREASTGVISLFCPIRMSKVIEREYSNGRTLLQGWYGTRIGRSTWGAQCLVFRRDWAVRLLADDAMATFIADPRWDKNVDALVAESINRKGREVVYRIPCLVDHTFGEANSSLGYKPDRPELKTKYFKEVS